jgi:hypothetical protein
LHGHIRPKKKVAQKENATLNKEQWQTRPKNIDEKCAAIEAKKRVSLE